MTSRNKLVNFAIAVALLLGLPAFTVAQMGSGSGDELQQKLMAMKQAAAANKQRLISISG